MADISTLVVKVDTRDVTKAKASLNDFAKVPTTVVKENTKLEKSNSVVNKSFTTLGKSVVALGVTYLGAQGILATAKLADEYTQLNAKLKLTSDTTEEFEKNYDALFRLSQNTGSSFLNNAQNFANMALAMESTNIQSSELVSIFETVNKSLVVAGASTEEASSFMLQFRQAMGSGVLQGDEFRAMMESNSFFGLQLAKALDTDVAGLRAMSKESLLTTDVIREAIPSMLQEIDEKFAELPITLGRAITELKNAWGDLVNDANSASGATTQIAESIQLLARYVEDNKDGIANAFVVAVELTTELLSTIINITNSLAGWKAVGDGRISIFEFATMDAEELSEWMKKDSAGIVDLNLKLEELKNKREDVANSWAFTSSERIGKQERLKSIDIEIATTKNLVSVIQEDYKDSWVASSKAVETVQKKASTDRVKTAKLTTTQIDKAEKALAKKHAEYAKAGAKLGKDSWLIQAEGAEEATRRGVQLLGELEEETEATTDAMSDAFSDFNDDMKTALGNGLGDVFVEEFGGIEGAWGGMWDSMLSKMGSAVVDMSLVMAEDAVNAIFSTDFDYFHSGSQGIKADETTAVLQEGEMVIPADASDQIRANLGMTSGSGGSGGDFSGLVGATEGGVYGGSPVMDSIGSAYLSKGKKAITSAIFSGDVSGAIKTLMGPGTALNILSSVATSEIKDRAGLTGVYAETGGSLANLLSALTLGGVVGGPLGILAGAAVNLLGSWGGDAFGDLVDDRENESLLDSYEDGTLTKEELAKRIQSANRYGSKPGDVSQLGSVIDGITNFIDGVTSLVTDPIQSAYESISNAFGKMTSTSSIPGSGGSQSNQDNSIGSGGYSGGTGNAGTGGGSAGYGPGLASGGIVSNLMVPQGDDGYAALKFGEGVLDTDTMGVLKRNIRTGGMGSNDKLLSSILDAITAGSYEIAKNTLGTYKLIRKFDVIGMPETRTV